MSVGINVNGRPSQRRVTTLPRTKRRKMAMRTIGIRTGGIASRWRRWVTRREIQESRRHEICPRCGAPTPSSRMSLREMAVTALCGSLLLSILISAFLIACLLYTSKTRDGPQRRTSCILSRTGVGGPQSFPSRRIPKMRLSWTWPSRAEDRFESWLAQRHEERVLAGETTPVGPCPDEAFLRDLARKAKRIALSDPRVSHAANCPTCMSRLLVFRQGNRSRRRKRTLVTAVVLCSVIGAVVITCLLYTSRCV